MNHLCLVIEMGYDGMSANRWISEVLEELATRCPVINSINIQSEKNTNKKQDERAFESFMNISDNPTS